MNKSFREFLMEKEEHKNGTYVEVVPNTTTKNLLSQWSRKHLVTNPIQADKYHTTLVYSRKGTPKVQAYPINLPIKCKVKELKIFPTQMKNTNGKCLVAVLDSKELNNHFDKIHRGYGCSYDFPEYIPHITLSYSFVGEVPKDLPDFEIVFDKKKVSALDMEYK